MVPEHALRCVGWRRFLKDGLPEIFTFAKKPIMDYVKESLKPGESIPQWMRWMVKGRFNLPTTPEPPMHISKGPGPSKRTQRDTGKSKKSRAKQRLKAARWVPCMATHASQHPMLRTRSS